MIIAMGSSINSSVLREKEHPPVDNRSFLIKNLLGRYVIIVIFIGRANSYYDDMHGENITVRITFNFYSLGSYRIAIEIIIYLFKNTLHTLDFCYYEVTAVIRIFFSCILGTSS